jgi:molecular chaperone GrpE
MTPPTDPTAPRPGPGDASDDAAVFAAAEEIVEEAVEAAVEVEEDLERILATVRRERDEYLDVLRRVQADFENYKKRMLRQQTDHLERAAEDLVTKVLPVLDAFDLARAHLGDGAGAGAEGKALLAASSLLTDTLAKEGLERIDDPGAPFDPTLHEAVDHVPDDEAGPADDPAGAPEGPVVETVLRAGYRWRGRVIRPAMVRVRG